MKYWRGYLAALILFVLSSAVNSFAEAHSTLIDMVWPYLTRYAMGYLAEWSGGVSFCLWQTVVTLAVVAALVLIVLVFIFRWNPIQTIGWMLAVVSACYFLNTCFWGMNYYASPLATDVRLEVTEYTRTELVRATTYYRDEANDLAGKVMRNADGSVDFGSFEEMANAADSGFKNLVKAGYPVFAGSTLPVKQLGWSSYYSSVGVTGITMALTGEAAVNPNIPAVSIPFTMCHEMAHRMSIAVERDANFAAYLACSFSDNLNYRYSSAYMAYRYCYIALEEIDPSSASQLMQGCSSQLKADFSSYDAYFQKERNEKATELSDKANDTYLKASGDSEGVVSYTNVTDNLVSWYLQTVDTEPIEEDTTPKFNPFDETQVDISDNANAASFGG